MTTYTNTSRRPLIRPEEQPRVPAVDQARDIAAIRAHYAATAHLPTELRPLVAALPAERRTEVLGEALDSEYADRQNEALARVDEDLNRILNDEVVPLHSEEQLADSEFLDSEISSCLAAEHLQSSMLAMQAAVEEFEAVVAYAYHVTRLSYGQIARMTGKSKSAVSDIVKRRRHLAVLDPEAAQQ